ncbi:MAG: NADH-quinone oxidoreductase subunit NuoB [Actinomycetota bacterium]|jgi:NADH:ubiquinone oxidoreductase subunit B-like Fe-S oxidoreductase|nr:NADH-quinone oxidoreductase subunit NuoB [Actinomycetota bacterium]
MKTAVKKNLNILVAGFGCCKHEIYAAKGPLYDVERFGATFVAYPEDADLLVIQGFINPQMQARILDYYKRMASPKWVALVGTCAIDGNILESNQHQPHSWADEIPIDIYVPGCPPRPEAFIYALLRLLDRQEQ